MRLKTKLCKKKKLKMNIKGSIEAQNGNEKSRFFSRDRRKTLFMEHNLLPFLHSLLFRYPPSLTLIGLAIELLQCLAFVLNPHNPGHYVSYALVYVTQLPFWDGSFMFFSSPSFVTLEILFIILAVVLASCIAVVMVAAVKPQFAIKNAVVRLQFRHIFSFMISVFFIPTIQTLLSGFICQRVPTLTEAERLSSSYNSGVEYPPHIVFFKDEPCESTSVTIIMAFSIFLLIVWGIISLTVMVTVIPVDREDLSARRRCSTHVDLLLFVYKVGLCVTLHMGVAYNVRSAGVIVAALASFVVAFAHGFFLPYYAHWMNRLNAAAFAVIGWAGITEFIAYEMNSQLFVYQGTMYVVLCAPGVLVGILAWYASGIRYNPLVNELLNAATDEMFVSVDKNPFLIAFLQNNFELLPFPMRLPMTDALFSPFFGTSVEILEETLREEDLLRRQGNMNNGEIMDPEAAAAKTAEAGGEEQAPDADIRIAEALGMDLEWNGVNLIAEASRRQVVLPTLETVWVPSDAEVCIRFLFDWQAKTETFPSPHMICFASRIFNRALLKWPRSALIYMAYIGFLCDYAPSFSRLSSSLDLLSYVTTECSNDLTETFLIFYFTLHVKLSLGIRSSLHQEMFLATKRLHEQTLLYTTLLWRSLQEEKRNVVTLYWFTSELSEVRWRCYNEYTNALENIVDDEVLVKNVGLFYGFVYHFKRSSTLCKMVARSLAQMQLMRLQRTFRDADLMIDAEEAANEAEKNGRTKEQKADDSSDQDQASSSRLSSATGSAGSSNTSSRVSSMSSGGRSSQARSRNAKRLAELMLEKVFDSVHEAFTKLEEHLNWSVLSICSFLAIVLLLLVITANLAVLLVKFDSWRSMTNTVNIFSETRMLTYLIVVQMYRVANMLSEVSYLLSTTEIKDIQGNITFFRATINAAEATAASLFYGGEASSSSSTLTHFTRERNFVRVYTTQKFYTEYPVSLLTHFSSVFSSARRVADLMDKIPSESTFLGDPNVLSLTQNIVSTLESTFTEVEEDLESSITYFATISAITFGGTALASVFFVGLACYLLLWNYRRAASVLASELRLFFIIPRESVKRLAQSSQKDMDSFAQVSGKSSMFSAFLYEGRKDATQASLIQSFGQREDAVSSALLSRLLDNKEYIFRDGGDSGEDYEANSTEDDTSLVQKRTAGGKHTDSSREMLEKADEKNEKVQKGKVKFSEEVRNGVKADAEKSKLEPSSQPVGVHTGNEAIAYGKEGEKNESGTVTFSSASQEENDRHTAKGKEERGSLIELPGSKRMHENGFMLLNDFAYPDFIRDSNKKESEDEGGLDEFLGAGIQIKDGTEETLNKFTWKRIIIFSGCTLVLIGLGLVFLLCASFSLRDLNSTVSSSYNFMLCAERLTNTTANMLFYSAWYIARENYDDFIAAQDAILESSEVLRACRSSVNNTDYFALREITLKNVLVALSLVVRASVPEGDQEMTLAYPIVLRYSWSRLLPTTSNVQFVEPYLTAEQLEDWVPYTSSEQDTLLDKDDMKELGIKTFFGPVGRALLVAMVQRSKALADDVLLRMRQRTRGSTQDLETYLILSIACWAAAALVSQLHWFSSSRKKAMLVLWWSILALFSVVVSVLSGLCFYHSQDLLLEMKLWGNEAAEVGAKNLLFLVTITDMLGYPLVPNDVALMSLINASSEEYVISFDTPFIPQPNEIYTDVMVSPYVSMVRQKNLFFHYGWLSVVCAIHGYDKNGITSLFLDNPMVNYLRWDMSTDELYNEYKPLYPSDTYLSTYAEDMAAADTLTICQQSMVNHLMTNLATAVWSTQLEAGRAVVIRYQQIGAKTREAVSNGFFASFFCAAVSVLALLCVLVTLTFYSVRAFSRSDEERMLYRAAFHSDGNKVLFLSMTILACLITVNILGLTFSLSSGPALLIGVVVLKIRWINNCLLAVSAALSSFTYYFDFMSLNLYLVNSLAQLNTWLQESYLSTPQAVDMAKDRFDFLFGTDTPFANFTSASSDTLFTSSCVDPTNKDGGNQQPLLIQNEVIYDLMRTVSTLPISVTSYSKSLTSYLSEAYDAMGPSQFAILNNSRDPLQSLHDQREMREILCIILVVLAVLLALWLYVFLLRKIVVKTKQQSVGTKVLLLGLPDDVLNTVPEIKEFYDPEAGSSDDQLKRKLLQSERLLQNILPPNISRRLKNGERVIADAHQSVTVVFASLVGFDEYSSKFDASGLVHFLNGIVVAFDHIVDLLDLEKVKTIADVYFFCGGLTKKTERDHPIRCIECSLFFFQALDDHNSRHSTPNIQLRVGINTDAAVAGVIGNKKVAYDLWGDCVNTASRMYSTGVAGRIQVSDNTYKRVSAYYKFEDRHVQAKGKGTLLTHLYVERVKSTAYADLKWRVGN